MCLHACLKGLPYTQELAWVTSLNIHNNPMVLAFLFSHSQNQEKSVLKSLMSLCTVTQVVSAKQGPALSCDFQAPLLPLMAEQALVTYLLNLQLSVVCAQTFCPGLGVHDHQPTRKKLSRIYCCRSLRLCAIWEADFSVLKVCFWLAQKFPYVWVLGCFWQIGQKVAGAGPKGSKENGSVKCSFSQANVKSRENKPPLYTWLPRP